MLCQMQLLMSWSYTQNDEVLCILLRNRVMDKRNQYSGELHAMQCCERIHKVYNRGNLRTSQRKLKVTGGLLFA